MTLAALLFDVLLQRNGFTVAAAGRAKVPKQWVGIWRGLAHADLRVWPHLNSVAQESASRLQQNL